MAQINYLISTTELSLTASGTTVGSGNTQSATLVVARTLVRTSFSAGELQSGTLTWSIHCAVSAMTTPYEMRLKIQRRDSGRTIRANTDFNLTGTSVDLTNRKSPSNYITCRAYQLAP